jgi:hypothetical protein
VVEGARLEIVYTANPYRGFESLSLRHIVILEKFFLDFKNVPLNPGIHGL